MSRTVGLQLVPQAQVGDYVLIHTGYAIGVIDEEEAQESLRLLNQIARGGEE